MNGTTETAEPTTTYPDGRSERRRVRGWGDVAAVLREVIGVGDVE